MALNVNTRVRWASLQDLDCLGSLQGKKVMDVGCGLGFFSIELAGRGAEVLGIDQDRASLDYLTSEYGISTHRVDVDREPLPGTGFDLILAGEILEHLADPSGFMVKVAKSLTPGGIVILTTPALEGWLTASRGKQLAHNHGSQRHQRIGFSLAELETLTTQAGLKLREHRFCLYTLAELFMQLTKVGYLTAKKSYHGQADVFEVAHKLRFKILRGIFPALWLVFRLESLISASLDLKGHCHIIVAQKPAE